MTEHLLLKQCSASTSQPYPHHEALCGPLVPCTPSSQPMRGQPIQMFWGAELHMTPMNVQAWAPPPPPAPERSRTSEPQEPSQDEGQGTLVAADGSNYEEHPHHTELQVKMVHSELLLSGTVRLRPGISPL